MTNDKTHDPTKTQVACCTVQIVLRPPQNLDVNDFLLRIAGYVGTFCSDPDLVDFVYNYEPNAEDLSNFQKYKFRSLILRQTQAHVLLYDAISAATADGALKPEGAWVPVGEYGKGEWAPTRCTHLRLRLVAAISTLTRLTVNRGSRWVVQLVFDDGGLVQELRCVAMVRQRRDVNLSTTAHTNFGGESFSCAEPRCFADLACARRKHSWCNWTSGSGRACSFPRCFRRA